MSDHGTDRLLAESAERERDHYWGKYRGTVSDVSDPDGMGRIKANVPEVLADAESPWALPCVPYAGQGHGLVLLPEVGDGVWIEFEGGDPSRPIWTGCWWASGEMPDPGAETVRALVTTPGHKLVLDEDADEIVLTHPGGAEVKMTSGEIKLSIGQAELILTSSEIRIKVGAGSVAVTASSVKLMEGAMEVGA